MYCSLPRLHTHTLSLSPVVFPEASLTPENLSTVLDIMSNRLWRRFGGWVNIPGSERDRIEAQCTSDRECKQALIHSFISSHPAPSWTLVAWALYMTEDSGTGDKTSSCLKALNLLQQLFPTGIAFVVYPHLFNVNILLISLTVPHWCIWDV